MSIKYIENINANHGLAVIFGTVFRSDYKYFQEMNRAIDNNNSLNFMVANFDNQKFNQDDLTMQLDLFMAKNQKTTVIIAVHGSEVFPGGDHYSIIGPGVQEPLVKDVLGEGVAHFMNGNFMRSSLILEAIGDAAKKNSGIELNVWQYSCQGAKLIEAAQEYLPSGVKYVAESKGFVNTLVFYNTFLQELESNHEFNFDKLYLNYLAMNTKISSFNSMEPVKFEIGKEYQNSIEKADMLVNDIRLESVNENKFENALNSHCQKLEAVNARSWFWHNNNDFCTLKKQSIQQEIELSPVTSSYEACVNHSDHGSYVGILVNQMIDFFKSFIFEKNQSLVYFDDNCITNFVGAGTNDFQSIAEHYYS